MALELTAKTVTKKSSGYDQTQESEAQSSGSQLSVSSGTMESRSDKNLTSSSSTITTKADKASIAFTLSFEIEITNRTPFNPNSNC